MNIYLAPRLFIAVLAASALLGCKENRVPNGIISEAVDEIKLANLANEPATRGNHLDRAIVNLELVERDYPFSRPARFLREGGRFSGMTIEDLKKRRATLGEEPGAVP